MTDMPLSTPGEEVAALDAATVLVVRGGDPLEVLMIERHIDSDFVGGAYVFPGGKVGASDRRLPVELWDGLDPEVEATRMVVSADLALGLYVAAVRETFEEAGVLLAKRHGSPVTAFDQKDASFVEARERLSTRGIAWDWTEWLRSEGLVLDLGGLRWWSWWVTPKGIHRRFDTRFFVARLPEGQQAAHDDVEATDTAWLSPRAALDAAEAGAVTIILPTRKNLEHLDRYSNPDEVWNAARHAPPRIEPEVRQRSDGSVQIRHTTFGDLEEI